MINISKPSIAKINKIVYKIRKENEVCLYCKQKTYLCFDKKSGKDNVDRELLCIDCFVEKYKNRRYLREILSKNIKCTGNGV